MEKFITYAQNCEDVVLYRALKTVKDGFYIDVGAADPNLHSVTKAFYERGWRGINVEPGRRPFRELQAHRPRDINVNCACGATNGSVDMFFVDNENELSTMHPTLMEQHRQSGWNIATVATPMRRVSDLIDEHAAGRDIHFLKVDAEGCEDQVLLGCDFSRHRPWIIVAEAHEPEFSSTYWQTTWATQLDQSGYTFCLMDGLNRFYVADEKWDALELRLRSPACVYDNYITAHEYELELRVQQLTEQIAHGVEGAAGEPSVQDLTERYQEACVQAHLAWRELTQFQDKPR
jgi:FkbM family methyltransferase